MMMMDIQEKLLEGDKVWQYLTFMVIKDLLKMMGFMKQKLSEMVKAVNLEEKRRSYMMQMVMSYLLQK